MAAKKTNIPELQHPPAKSHASSVWEIFGYPVDITILQVVFLLVIFIILFSCHTIILFVAVSLLYCIQDKSFSHSRQDGDLNIASCFFH